MLINGVGQFAEQQVFTERRGEVAIVLRQVDSVELRIASRRLNGDTAGAVLVVPLIRSKKEQPVTLDWSSDAQRRKDARIIRHGERRWSAVRASYAISSALVLE